MQLQDDRPRLWALVEPSAEMETRFFVIVGTGRPTGAGPGAVTTKSIWFLGTYQQREGYVGHVFEVYLNA